MITRPNFERLEKVVEATEKRMLKNFAMNSVYYESPCGAAGCLIGNYNAAVGCRPKLFTKHVSDFDISPSEFSWLFEHCAFVLRRLTTDWCDIGIEDVTREQALSRLRKFIAYKRRKDAMLYDECGVREEARRKEGDHCFVSLALQDAREAEAHYASAQ